MIKGKSANLRKGRYSEPGRIYLVTVITRERAKVFNNWEAARPVIESLKATTSSGATLTYVIMPDHIHWLVQLGESDPLSDVVQKFKSTASRRFNRLNGTVGSLWQKGFHERAIRHDEDVLAAARYIVANPLRAGLVRSVREYSMWDAAWL
ncbi:REP-associated tyrosine transposase [Marinobacter daqiaonensis]|uniref:REP-associated tyrosine transposase n=1 Tax=Marinobacter daqiaonensis TaxID=650891 RepID=UPI001432E199|nr:transposase [Marinobacter daqiaonensis]